MQSRDQGAPATGPLSIKLGVLVGALMLPIGLLAAWTGCVFLAPPLGVTAYLGVQSPRGVVSRPRNIIAGHAIGLAAGIAAQWISGAGSLPPALPGALELSHVVAACLAVALAALGTEHLKAQHPPALATTLVVALGFMRDPIDMLAFLGGAFLLVVLLAPCRSAARPATAA